MKFGLWFSLIVLLLPTVFGATIHGTIYDIGLSKLSNVVVEINTTPRQVLVSKDGAYSFTVPAGKYTLSAARQDLEAKENITAVAEGDYVLDLILFPGLEAEEELLVLEEPDVGVVEQVFEEKKPVDWLVWLVVFALLGYVVYRVSKKPTKVVEKEIVKEVKEVVVGEDLNAIMEFVEKEGGRTTQKDVRKNFPYSEAKISLMLDELESKGLIKRVKKGRGNLIIKG